MATHKLQANFFCKILPVDTILILFGQWFWEVIFYFHKQILRFLYSIARTEISLVVKIAKYQAFQNLITTPRTYDIDDEQMLRQENWYEVKIYVGESLEPKDFSVLKLSYNSGNKIFDAVMFSKTEKDDRYFSFYLAANKA